MSGRL